MIAPSGLVLDGKRKLYGSVAVLSERQARYLLLAGELEHAPSGYVEPVDPYVPPVVGPVPATETNTTLEIVVAGVSVEVTVENLINLFPRLRPQAGPAGPTGPQGPEGPQGPPGQSAVGTLRVVSDPGVLQVSVGDDLLLLRAGVSSVLLEAAPLDGARHAIKDAGAVEAAGFSLPVSSAGGHTIDGQPELVFSVSGQAATFVFKSGLGWYYI